MSNAIARRLSSATKTLLGWFLFRTRLYRLLWRDKAIVVVFHRVNNAYPNDPITLTATDFDRFIGFFTKFFEIVPLSQLLDRIANKEKLPSSVTITFDDGYRGNATIASPILKRHGAKGCFFISTAFIDSDYVPWWDKDQGIQTQWMSWDQVRALRDEGHEIGAHTETHVDLGVVSPEEARKEIRGAEDRIARELGESTGLFAYPFGQRANMSEANQAILPTLGIRCSLSAFGGFVRAGDDPFRLKRVNISAWFASPYQFGFEMVSGRLEQ